MRTLIYCGRSCQSQLAHHHIRWFSPPLALFQVLTRSVIHLIQIVNKSSNKSVRRNTHNTRNTSNTRNASNTSVGIAHNSRDAISASNVRT